MASVIGDNQFRKFGAKSEVDDQSHIKMHLKDKIDIESMTHEQQIFHYFRMYDLNRDNVLDGLELLKMNLHVHDGLG
ncbi:hypothetical protein Q1695_002050 [Nippostrongylus brasiliensis]|nr:hypothetical protein Q1695_002050 [Nippostrongylus brasiliensis]